MVFADGRTRGQLDRHRRASPTSDRQRFSITDAEAHELARYAVVDRKALRPPDGHRMGPRRRGRQALHPAGAAGDGEVARVRRQSAAVPAEGKIRGARERPRDRPEDRAGRGAPRQVRRRDGPRQGGRRAGRRHDRPGLGAGDEARRGDRHQSRRAHLPRGDHRARARHPGGRRLRRRDARARGRRAR